MKCPNCGGERVEMWEGRLVCQEPQTDCGWIESIQKGDKDEYTMTVNIIERLIKERDEAQDMIVAIMVFVDKWFDKIPDTNPADRANAAREIALGYIERLEIDKKKLEVEMKALTVERNHLRLQNARLSNAVNQAINWIDGRDGDVSFLKDALN